MYMYIYSLRAYLQQCRSCVGCTDVLFATYCLSMKKHEERECLLGKPTGLCPGNQWTQRNFDPKWLQSEADSGLRPS